MGAVARKRRTTPTAPGLLTLRLCFALGTGLGKYAIKGVTLSLTLSASSGKGRTINYLSLLAAFLWLRLSYEGTAIELGI